MRKIAYLLILACFIGCSNEDTTETIGNDGTENDGGTTIKDDSITEEQKELYSLIMEYRKQNNLPIIPLSKSLNFVAQTHVIDLEENQPVGGKCNLHSWSNKGKWTPVCYTGDHNQAKKMWNKPRELTSYTGNGYEISYGASGYKVTPSSALKSWKKSVPHRDVILNEGMWKNKWNAIGVGIYGGYSVVWFGYKVDK